MPHVTFRHLDQVESLVTIISTSPIAHRCSAALLFAEHTENTAPLRQKAPHSTAAPAPSSVLSDDHGGAPEPAGASNYVDPEQSSGEHRPGTQVEVRPTRTPLETGHRGRLYRAFDITGK